MSHPATMRCPSRIVRIAVLPVALLALLVAAPSAYDAETVRTDDGPFGATAPFGTFTITGFTSRQISPGVQAPIDVVLHNHAATDLSVSHLVVAIQQITAPQADATHPCTRKDFVVRQLSIRGSMALPAKAIRSLRVLGVAIIDWPRVGMIDRPREQDGCKGADLTLTYRAVGSRR